MKRSKAFRAVVTAAAAVTLAGCGGSTAVSVSGATTTAVGGTSSEASRSSAAPSSSSVASPSSAAPSSVAAVALPPHTRWSTVSTDSVTLATPTTWISIDPKAVRTDPKVLAATASRMGVTQAPLKASFSRVDLFVVGERVNGFTPNINAIVLPFTEVPADDLIHQELLNLHATSIKLSHTTTRLGSATEVSYVLPLGSKAAQGWGMYALDGTGHCINISVGTPTRSLTDVVASNIRVSIHHG